MSLCHNIGVYMARTGRPGLNFTPQRIRWAIKSTQSMKQAADYLNTSFPTFKKYAIQFDLWDPKKSSKGIRRSSTGTIQYDINKILNGENPNPYREDTLLKKAIREGLMKCECGNCGIDFSIDNKIPPLVLDFLDKNTQNTKIDNLRALCFNCMYVLSKTNRGWYRHRKSPIQLALNDVPAEIDVNITDIPSDEPEVDYMPFEEFQKLL